MFVIDASVALAALLGQDELATAEALITASFEDPVCRPLVAGDRQCSGARGPARAPSMLAERRLSPARLMDGRSNTMRRPQRQV